MQDLYIHIWRLNGREIIFESNLAETKAEAVDLYHDQDYTKVFKDLQYVESIKIERSNNTASFFDINDLLIN